MQCLWEDVEVKDQDVNLLLLIEATVTIQVEQAPKEKYENAILT